MDAGKGREDLEFQMGFAVAASCFTPEKATLAWIGSKEATSAFSLRADGVSVCRPSPTLLRIGLALLSEALGCWKQTQHS
jgi:hypothetical protein